MATLTQPTFSIALWDCENEYWSEGLAALHLSGQSVELSRADLNLALRELRQYWDDVSILVTRDEPGASE